MTDNAQSEPYLADVRARLPASPATNDLLDELRDHLHEAARADGPQAAAATRLALADLGPAVELARAFEPLIEQREARRLGARVALASGWLCAAVVVSFVLAPALLGRPISVGTMSPLATLLGTAVAILSIGGLTLLGRISGESRWRRSLPLMAAATGVAGAAFVLAAPLLTAITAQRLADILGWHGQLLMIAGALVGLIGARIAAAPAFAMALRNRRRVLHRRELAVTR